MESDRYWIWLASAGVNVNSKAAVVEEFGSAEAAFRSAPGELYKVQGVLRRDAELLEKKDLSEADRIIKACADTKTEILSIEASGYPERLKNIYAPPYVLYYRGNLPDIDSEAVLAVVGTRDATSYGKRMSRDIAYQYARCGGIIASGLTAGIEECAAEAALSAGGRVIAYLGTPVDRAVTNLAKRVEASGVLISEYAPGTVTQKIFFRHRNRIGAGISAGVCAVEAPARSGTVLFVSEALEQGKQIFAVPGNADSESSEGTLRFIKEGAMLVTCGNEIAAELLSEFPEKLDPGHTETFRHTETGSERSSPADEEKSIEIDLDGLTDVQKVIVRAVADGAGTLEELQMKTRLSSPMLLSQLTVLEIKRRLVNDKEKGITVYAASK